MSIALSRRARITLAVAAATIALLLIVAASFPVAWLKGTAERRLSEQFGSPARIGALGRETPFSFRPVIRASDVHVAQPAWAGEGALASIGELRVRLRLWPLLMGRVQADLLSARGVRLDLVRDADGRTNWRPRGGGDDQGGGAGMAVGRVEDAVVRYRDALQQRAFTLALSVDGTAGLRARGSGSVDGAPVTLRATGAPMVAGRPWTFDAAIDGPALAIRATGRMEGPLRTDGMAFRMTARADDLKRIDRVIEAGLFGTQPVDLAADVRHADGTWTIERLSGRIGESELTGRLTARRADGRTKLDGDVRFARLGFEDLASDAGNAQALALERAEGLRLVPNTRINIRKIDATDGRITVKVDRIAGGRRPSSLTTLDGVLTLEDRILTVEPLRIGLSRGAITGKAIVDQRDGRPKPRVTLALDMTDSSIAALAGGGEDEIDGRVDARVRLTGTGDTIREAVGTSDGTIGVVARSGSLPTKIAALIGFDIGRGLFGDGDEPAALRCAVLRLNVREGRGTLDPLVVDTGISQSRGTGTIVFPGEALAITLTGAPKGDAALRLPGSVSLRGTIREPDIVVPEGTRSVGNVLKAVGRAIAGRDGPPATDADCAALTRAAIGG